MAWWTLPIGLFRRLAAPCLLYPAWLGLAYLILLTAAFVSVGLDGLAARRLRQLSSLGAQLDTWGDGAIYLTLPLICWWLWPEVMRREWLFIAMRGVG